MMKNKITFLVLFIYGFSIAQLNPFTISVTATSETCPNNGALSWTTSNTQSGSTIIYSIYKAPNYSTAITTTSSTAFNGLSAGNYRVVATQTAGTQSNQAQADIAINDQKVTLNYTMTYTNEACGNDGSITVNVSSGKPAYTYQLLDNNLNLITQQANNVFTGLEAGNYFIRVIDQCGMGVAKSVTLLYRSPTISDFGLSYASGSNLNTSCNGVNISYSFFISNNTANSVKLPITAVGTYTNPTTGATESFTHTITSIFESNGGANYQNYTTPIYTLPYFSAVQSLNINFVLKDGCGNTYNYVRVLDYNLKPSPFLQNSNCGGKYLAYTAFDYIRPPYVYPLSSYKIDFISAPVGFDPVVYSPSHGTPQATNQYGSPTQPLPEGSYTVRYTDYCGRTTDKTFVVANEVHEVNFFPYASCPLGSSAIGGTLSPGFYFDTVTITSAPADFPYPLPYQVPSSNFINTINNTPSLGQFFMSGVPPGNYTYEYTTTCSANIYTKSLTVLPTTDNSSVTVNATCDAISGTFTRNVNPTAGSGIIFQKFYPATDDWSHIGSYFAPSYNDPYPGSNIGSGLIGSGNFSFSNLSPGTYRIISTIQYPGSDSNNNQVWKKCLSRVLKEFTIGASLKFINAYSFKCANNAYDVTIDATGSGTLTYSIVSDGSSSATVLQNNGTNPIFNGLPPGEHYFRIYDSCGNFITRKLDITTLGSPAIRKVADCATNNLKLVVDGVSYLNFRWYKSTDPVTTLSTTNVLDLGVFDASKAGEYRVQLTNTSSTISCVNTTLSINVTADAFTSPSAGTGQTITLYSTPSPLNLFDYLTGPYEGGGTWAETSATASNLLNNNTFFANFAQSGTYDFKYTVNALCGGSTSSSTVRITLIKICYKLPAISGGTTEATKFGITVLGRAGEDQLSGGNWPMIRKGGWIALEANNKGFVPNRLAFDSTNLPVGIDPSKFVSGMMAYDTTNHCLKIYNGSIWSCYTTQTCPE